MRRGRWGLPLALGVLTFVLLALVLWPHEPPKVPVVVAARDLGAGMTLAASDLTTTTMAKDQAPADAVADPATLAGQALAVVRFAGEPVTPRHLGPAVQLGAGERGIAVQVQADTGLAGLLRPGMKVGVVATLQNQNQVYAKAMLEGLRVLYVPPDFQARPYTPTTAQMTVQGGNAQGDGGLLGGSQPATASQPASGGTLRDGVVVLAAGTQPQLVAYDLITSTLPITLTDESGKPVPGSDVLKDKPAKQGPGRWVVPVELLAALNAAKASFTLVLEPEKPEQYITPGLSLERLIVDTSSATETDGQNQGGKP
jgi:hypothetical protein